MSHPSGDHGRVVVESRGGPQGLPAGARWGALPMAPVCPGAPPQELARRLPRFEKLPASALGLADNPHFDLVVPVGAAGDAPPAARVPVGLVSKTYRLIQHGEVYSAALRFAGSMRGWDLAGAEANLSPHGERAFLRLDMRPQKSIAPDGHDLALQIVCRNSVDGSCAVRAHLGWFRFVCANGMMVRVTLGRARLAHRPEAVLCALFRGMETQLPLLGREWATLERWARTPVKAERLQEWVDGPLAKAWGPLAATRVWTICREGADAAFLDPFEGGLPSRRAVRRLRAVPGAEAPARNRYAVAQALSWVASRAPDVADAALMQGRIGPLLSELKN